MTKATKTDMDRFVRAISGQTWQIQGRGDLAEGLKVAFIGPDKDSIVAQVQDEFAEDVCTINNLALRVFRDAERCDKWRQVALGLAALMLSQTPEGKGRCNVCGMIEMHLPKCPTLPLFNNIKYLDRHERAAEGVIDAEETGNASVDQG